VRNNLRKKVNEIYFCFVLSFHLIIAIGRIEFDFKYRKSADFNQGHTMILKNFHRESLSRLIIHRNLHLNNKFSMISVVILFAMHLRVIFKSF